MRKAMFIIVRHGNTFAAGEPARRIGALTDLPLTGTGITQAQTLGAHFAALGWHFTRVLASPLIRTRQTAQAILDHQTTAPRPETCDWLREIDHGPDENQSEEVVLARIGANALAAWDNYSVPPLDWTLDTDQRIMGWRTLFADQSLGRTLLVTSNGAARFAFQADPALMANAPHSLKLPTGSYGLICKETDGVLTVPIWGKRP